MVRRGEGRERKWKGKLGEKKEWQLQSVCEVEEGARQTGAQESEMCCHTAKMSQEILAALFVGWKAR
eukprot:3041954-Rhodomonas_salina.1